MDFDFPTLAEWPQYQRDCAELFSLMAIGVPDLWLLDDIESMQGMSAEGYYTWARVAAQVCRAAPVAERIIRIVVDYLDPQVDGLGDEDDHAGWMGRHVTASQAVHLLALILCAGQMLEKKTRLALMEIFRLQTARQSSSASPKPEPPRPTRSRRGPTPRLLSFN